MPGSSQPPGWYPDPSGAPGQRWWDGTQWGGPFGQSPPPVGPSPGSPNPWQRFRALPKAAQVVSWVVVVFVAMGIIGSIGGGGDDDDEDDVATATNSAATVEETDTTSGAPATAPANAVESETTPAPTTASEAPATTTTTAAPATTTTLLPPGAGEILGGLAVAVPTDALPDYDRDLFGGDWTDADSDCQDTRQEVLVEESGIAVETFANCGVVAGSWLSSYDLVTQTDVAQLEVDHLVPLANAWRSGAYLWTPAERLSFANDLSYPGHLNAVTADVNAAKGDSGPENWRPPAPEGWCRYAIDWITIKQRWELTVTPDERAALTSMLSTCAPTTTTQTTAPPPVVTTVPPPTTTTTAPPPPPPPPTTAPAPSSAYYANCDAARAAGAAPLHRGDPGYRSGLDRDDDGVACE
jgi:hypothetical protein